MKPRRTQAERREQTRAIVLESAARLFGEHGYAETHLEQIAAEAGTTIRPIYHYFGNKKALFEAVCVSLEAELVGVLQDPSFPEGRAGLLARFQACLRFLAQPEFQRIVLLDAPAVLGQSRWAESPVVRAASDLMGSLALGDDPVRGPLIRRMLIGALTEAALALAESKTKAELDAQVQMLLGLATMVLPPDRPA